MKAIAKTGFTFPQKYLGKQHHTKRDLETNPRAYLKMFTAGSSPYENEAELRSDKQEVKIGTGFTQKDGKLVAKRKRK